MSGIYDNKIRDGQQFRYADPDADTFNNYQPRTASFSGSVRLLTLIPHQRYARQGF